MGFGAAPLGNFFRAMSDGDAATLIDAVWQAGVRYFDTAQSYGHGLSEARCGQGLRWHPRDQFVLSTKVGRLLEPDASTRSGVRVRFDYTRDAVLRSFDESLARLDDQGPD